MSSASYLFSLTLRVDDEAALFRAALERYALENKTMDNTEALLGTVDAPNVDGCLAMLLDPCTLPGCSLDEHEVQCLSYAPPEGD